MNNYYFTFGSDPAFPYQNTYLVVQAETFAQAISLFRIVHPDRLPGGGVYNASDCYSQVGWGDFAGEHYTNQEPAEIIRIEVVKP